MNGQNQPSIVTMTASLLSPMPCVAVDSTTGDSIYAVASIPGYNISVRYLSFYVFRPKFSVCFYVFFVMAGVASDYN